MNHYGIRAMRHWQTFLPNRYAQLTDPHSYFTELGRQVEAEITELAAARAAEEEQAPTYLEQVGLLTRIRAQAEEQILTEQVLLPSEADLPGQSRPQH
ncbi:hypothetical protein [Pseudonocardia sp. NPDC049635]|uniref:hypothetical protein n=1 Tax=Pseudonocardia sp. NPDC049635 TaxID=3155506 RepID=UPI003405D503